MKKERPSEEEQFGRVDGNYCPLFIYNNSTRNDNINDDLSPPIDFHLYTNNVSRVDYSRDFDDDEMKPSHQLLNLDAPTQRKFLFDFNVESSNNKSIFQIEIDDEMEIDDRDSWSSKRVEEWIEHDTIKWYFNQAIQMGQSYAQMTNTLAIPGNHLLRLSKSEFIKRDKLFGAQLYDSLHKYNQSKNFTPLFNKFKSDDDSSLVSSTNYSDGESISGSEFVKKRPPGRPRTLNPKVKEPKVKLWEFVRNMLFDPRYCPNLIRWVDYKSKRFCFVKSDQVAKLWGERKRNSNMTYEKFSRAMRYYYEKDIFQAVVGRRLVYQFGKNATGLETDNPNFMNTEKSYGFEAPSERRG